eukprot:8768836-Pyramimonas_sp.AAC.1
MHHSVGVATSSKDALIGHDLPRHRTERLNHPRAPIGCKDHPHHPKRVSNLPGFGEQSLYDYTLIG